MIHVFKVEILRVLKSRATWAAAVSVFLGFVSGVLNAGGGTTMTSLYLAKQTGSGCLAGTAVFALLTLYEMNRIPKYRVDAITDCMISPIAHALSLQVALCVTAFVTAAFSAVLYMPYAIWKLGIVFSLSDYLLCFFVYIFPAMVFGSLAAAVCYNLTRRTDVSALAVAAYLIWVWRMQWQEGYASLGYLLRWSFPPLPAMSDDFSNASLFRAAAYNRLVWLAIFGAAWVFSLCFIRRYGKKVAGSFLIGVRKVWPVFLAGSLMVSGVLLWRNEPFFDNTPADYLDDYIAVMTRPSPEGLFLESTHAEVDLTDTFLGRLKGIATYDIRNETGCEQELLLRLNSGYTVRRVTANGQDIPFADLNNDLLADRDVRIMLPPDDGIELCVEYGGAPKSADGNQSIFLGRTVIGNRAILDTSLKPNCGIEIDEDAPSITDITLPGHMTPVTNGYSTELIGRNDDGSAVWRASNPGANSVLLFAADYIKVDLNGGGIPIEFYYSAKHREQIEDLDAINVMEEAIRFCTEHFGPRADKPFKIVQSSELMFGGFAGGNISAMGEYGFTADYLGNTEIGASGAEVLAHEIIHQWWGLGAQLADTTDPDWTAEGITTYMTYRLLKELRGEDYANTHYKAVWEEAVRDMEANFYVRNPEYMDMLPERYRVEVETMISGVKQYGGYALMFCRAAELLGEDTLDEVLSQLYTNGGTEMPPFITLNDFLSASGLTKEVLNLA